MIIKLAMAIDLDELDALQQEFLDEWEDEETGVTLQLAFSLFMDWARKRRENNDNGIRRGSNARIARAG